MMAPAVQPSSNPKALPMPISAIPMVAMVVHDEPDINDTKAHIRHEESRKTAGCIICMP